MKSPIQICHLTTVHPRDDVRVFFKECTSLANMDYSVTLIVADGKGDELKNNVKIIDLGNFRNDRVKRLFNARYKLFTKAISLNADLYHFHDPELLPIGLKLKAKNKKVVYDCHEDVGKQILYKEWLGPLFVRKILSKLYNTYEKYASNKMDGVISVIDEITNKFQIERKITLKNYPTIKDIESQKVEINQRKKQIVYIGSLSKVRGILDYINAMPKIKDYELLLIGQFSSQEFMRECMRSKGWASVNYVGFQPMDKAIKLYANAYIGLSVLHPEQNYLTSLPTKGFEYMAAGIPTVMSNFDYWIPYFKDCSEFVEPKDPEEIAKAINRLISDRKRYNAMSKHCELRAKDYSWEMEAERLKRFYQTII
jgi:glycosyltransferase involved in cell wall biosynthesis